MTHFFENALIELMDIASKFSVAPMMDWTDFGGFYLKAE